MALAINTFDSKRGGLTLFKALGHPDAVDRIHGLIAQLAAPGPVALYDPDDAAGTLAALYDLSGIEIAARYVQDWSRIGSDLLGAPAEPITAIGARAEVRTLFIASFDGDRRQRQIAPLLPKGIELMTLETARIDPVLLTRPDRYLDPLNFATNFAFFRDEAGLHTRLVTADYWRGYGAERPWLWLTVFAADGRRLATWREEICERGSVVIDSRAVRRRFGLPPFAGQLFLHVVGAAGHDIVKYALDIFDDEGRALSATHDANAWPAEFYAGLPAPAPGERVLLWLENAHPAPIPPGALALAPIGRDDRRVAIEKTVPGFATVAVDLGSELPQCAWPDQLEISAGRHLVRPRYEIIGSAGRRRIAHCNVERTDLRPDRRLKELAPFLGKGFLLPAPILPVGRWRSLALPTPMARSHDGLPVAALIYDAEGREVARHAFGCIPRAESRALDAGALLTAGARDAEAYGHVELVYDFAVGEGADGWLHGLFRYEDRESGHGADTSFGAHIFNTAMTFESEPQSYAGPPPGLSTRLFLRLGEPDWETLCQLIYPASTPWRAFSETRLVLVSAAGEELGAAEIAIPCSGSRLLRPAELFGSESLDRAGSNAYLVVRDRTCRLFGYHGLLGPNRQFSLDHMFGF